MKPYFENDDIKIYQGDCREILPEIKDIGLTLTSPPYNAAKEYGKCEDNLSIDDYWKFTKEWMGACRSSSVQGGWIAANIPFWSGSRPKIFMPNKFIELMEEVEYEFKDWITWVKGSLEAPVTNTTGWGNYPTTMSLRAGAEPILIGRNGWSDPTDKDITWKEWAKWSVSVWSMPCSHNKEHPATFPIDLPTRIIKLYAAPADVILDPFMGTGTTIDAAYRLGRKAIGIELEERFCEIAAKTLSQLRLF
jgi:site-specific DNA-methyltransferase (adenine-specific)